jgi:importin subunit alpha-6/7
VTPALRALGNIVTGDEIQTQVVINAGALHSLGYIFKAGKRALKKEAAWVVSNVMAGTQDQIQAVIDAGLVSLLIAAFKIPHPELRKEACCAFLNATFRATPDQLLFLVKAGVITALSTMVPMEFEDGGVAVLALDAFANILKAQKSLVADGKITDDEFKGFLRADDTLEILQDTYDETDFEDVRDRCRELIFGGLLPYYLQKFENELEETGLPPDEGDSVFDRYAEQLQEANDASIPPQRRLLKATLLLLSNDYPVSTLVPRKRQGKLALQQD